MPPANYTCSQNHQILRPEDGHSCPSTKPIRQSLRKSSIRSAVFLYLFLYLFPTGKAFAESNLTILALVGEAGTEEYEKIFATTATVWEDAAKENGATFEAIGLDSPVANQTDASLFQKRLSETQSDQLWVVLIGHGSYDGVTAKFNARGPDFTDDELAEWLNAYPGELALIHGASSSGGLIQKSSRPGRIIITATKNEAEASYTRFGTYFAEAIAAKADADLDNDDQVSLLEAFLYASRSVAGFYESEGRIATEHALLDDNGDKLGSRAEWFEGTTATRTPAKDVEPDGERAGQFVLSLNEFERQLSSAQRKKRDDLERQVKELRRNRDELEESVYYKKLEILLLDLARIYENVSDS